MLDTPVGPLSLSSPEEHVAAYRRLRDHVKSLPHDEAMTLVDRLVAELGPEPDGLPGVLGWEALRDLAAEGVALAAHSRTHPLLNRLAPDAWRARSPARWPTCASARAPPPGLRVPGGGVSADAARVVAEAGAVVAFTTEVGGNDARGSRLASPAAHQRRAAHRPARRPAGAHRAGRGHGAARERGRRAPARTRPAATPHVAYVTSRFPKLSETFVLTELLAVRGHGVQVDVHPLQRKREPADAPRGPRPGR